MLIEFFPGDWIDYRIIRGVTSLDNVVRLKLVIGGSIYDHEVPFSSDLEASKIARVVADKVNEQIELDHVCCSNNDYFSI